MGGPPNKSYAHTTTSTATLLVSGNAGTILGSIVINTAGTGGGGVLTIYDGTSAAAPATVVAVCNTQNAAIPALTYDLTLSRGLYVTMTAGTTTQSDLTITYD